MLNFPKMYFACKILAPSVYALSGTSIPSVAGLTLIPASSLASAFVFPDASASLITFSTANFVSGSW